MRIRLLFTVLLLGFSVSGLCDAHIERVWHGKNGKTFRGNYIGETDGKYDFIAGKNRFSIAPGNLSEEDVAWLKAKLSPPAPSKKAQEQALNAAFLPTPVVDRSEIPVINQADFGNKASDCVPSTICNFLLWWDQLGFLPLDRKGDFEKKAEWIHDTMGRYFKTRNNSGTSASDAAEGINRYFERYLKDQATYRIVQTLGTTPAMMNHYCQGPNVVALEVSVYHDDKYESGHWVALLDAKKAGKIVFNTWGAQFTGTIKVHDEKPKISRQMRNQTYAEISEETLVIVFDNPEELPSWMKAQEVTFRIDPEKWDGLFVLIPSKFSDQKFANASPPPFSLSTD